MSNAKRKYRKNAERRIYVRGERHDPPDTYLLARALLDLAAEMAGTKVNAEAAQKNPADLDPGAQRQPETQP